MKSTGLDWGTSTDTTYNEVVSDIVRVLSTFGMTWLYGFLDLAVSKFKSHPCKYILTWIVSGLCTMYGTDRTYMLPTTVIP